MSEDKKKVMSAEDLVKKMRQNNNRMNTKGSEAMRIKKDQKSSTVGSD